MATQRIYNVNIQREHPSSLIYLNHITTTSLKASPLPSKIDLREKCPPIQDQSSLGSCTANALAAAFEFADETKFTPSRLFIYFNERMLENSIDTDSGAKISDGVRTLQKYGVCPETEWGYDISKFTVKPPKSAYMEALKHKAISVSNIAQNSHSMKSVLASGLVFVVGIAVYESFESEAVAKSGVVPLPNKKTENLLGGHAVVVVGYDDDLKVWIMRNSWGVDWGQKGYFTLPYQYLLDPDLSSDLWNIAKIQDSTAGVLANHIDYIKKIQVEIEKIENLLESSLTKVQGV